MSECVRLVGRKEGRKEGRKKEEEERREERGSGEGGRGDGGKERRAGDPGKKDRQNREYKIIYIFV